MGWVWGGGGGGGAPWVWVGQVSSSMPTATSMMANGRTTRKMDEVRAKGAPVLASEAGPGEEE